MTTNLAHKTSAKVSSQLPEFVRSNETFVAFIQAYYEWMEQQNIGDSKEGVIYGTQNLTNYQDVDYKEPGESFNKFIDYYVNDFLPNFPTSALTDKTKLLKIAKKLYEIKGTPASYQFLFRALYNSDAEIFLTRDAVFKASDGKWYVSKSLRLATNDETFLSIQNLRIIGLTSKSIATVERGIQVGNRIELYISDIERLFQSGEDIQVVDNNNQPLYFLNGAKVDSSVVGSTTLTAKILGSISSININSKKRGQLYVGRSATYSGDPVVFYGGLNNGDGVGATAYVNETTTGSLRAITLIDGSYGYREDPNTYIQISGGGGSGAIANVGSVNPATQIDVNYIPKDYLSTGIRNMTIGGSYTAFSAGTTINAGSFIVGQKYTILFVGTTNFTLIGASSSTIGVTFTATGVGSGTGTATFIKSANTSMANALSFSAFSTYSIASVLLNNGGGGYSSLPTVRAKSLYDTTDPQIAENLKIKGLLGSLGILGPITITTPGTGYANGDIITFVDGHGNGANANVLVNATGSIISTQYKYANTSSIILYPKGGMGYSTTRLPTLNVVSSGGTGAVLNVFTVLGENAILNPVADERGIGAITSFVIENFGEDYISAPNISLRVRDLVVKNVSLSNIVKAGELIYQGTSVNAAVSKSYVDSIKLLTPDAVPANSTYLLRTYDYTSNTKTTLQLNVTDRTVGSNIYLDLVTSYNTYDTGGNYVFQNGVRTYGNGAAAATAKFLNGLIVGEGQYIKDDGFPSSFQVLENEDYNSFTYQLTVQKSFDAYKDVLFKLLHPSGTKIIPINAIKSQETIDIHRESYQANSHTLNHYTGSVSSNATIYTNFTNNSNNIVKFDLLAGANIETFIFPGSKFSINSNNGPNVYSQIISTEKIDPATNFFRQSEDFSTTWIVTNATVTNNAIVAPDGLTTADKIGANLISGSHSVVQTYTVANNTTYNYSVYVKAAEESVILLRATGATEFGAATSQFCTFNVISQAVTVGAQGEVGSGNIVSVGNGWYRCNVATVPTVAAGAVSFTLTLRTASSYLPATADLGLYLWGAQLNTGSEVNRYIKTTTATLTDAGGSNTAVIRDNVFSSFANVATANVTTSNNRINIRTITNEYDIINNGEYSNTSNKMEDIVFAGDSIRVVSGSSAFYGTVTYVSYSNNVIFANTTIPFSSNTANVSVSRNITAFDGLVNIYNTLGSVFYPELITQSGQSITTQDGTILILG